VVGEKRGGEDKERRIRGGKEGEGTRREEEWGGGALYY